jgi:hypothetical protein
MPIFTAEANGTPFVVFEAQSEQAAGQLLDEPSTRVELSTRHDKNHELVWAGVTPLTIRLATGSEREIWKAKGHPRGMIFLLETTIAPGRPG